MNDATNRPELISSVESQGFRRANGLEPFGDELTLAETVATIYDEWRGSGVARWILAFAVAAGMAVGVYTYVTSEVRYRAHLAFVVNEEGDSGSRIAGMLGGLGMGSIGSSSPYKVLAIAESNVITDDVLLDQAARSGDSSSIMAKLVTLYPDHFSDLAEKFPYTESDRRTRDSYLRSATALLLTSKDPERLVKLELQDESGLMSIDVGSKDEELSIRIAESYYEHLAEYYTERAIEPQRSTVERLRSVRDSLFGVISEAETKLANIVDRQRGLLLNSARLPAQRLEQQRLLAQSSLVRVAENLAVAEFSLQSVRPYFQIVNRPYAPLQKTRAKLHVNLTIGALVGGVIGIGLIVATLFLKEVGETANRDSASVN